MGSETIIIILAAIVSAAVAAVLAWFSSKRKSESEPEHMTMSFLVPTISAMYLLVLALALANEWQTIGSAQNAVGNQAVAIRQLYLSASGLSAAQGDELQTQVRDYTTTVLQHDWPQMKAGAVDDRSESMLTAMSTFVLKINPQSGAASNAQSYAVGQLSTLASTRAQLVGAAGSRLPIGVLVAVVILSLIMCLFPFAGGMRVAALPIAMAALQITLLVIAVIVMFQFDNPYTGPLATNSSPIAAVAAQIGAK